MAERRTPTARDQKPIFPDRSGKATRVLDRLGHSLQQSGQSIVDFLVADACLVCGARHRDRASGSVRFLPPAVRFLAGETVIRLLGVLPIKSHPFCVSCLARSKIAVGLGRIGLCDASGVVKTQTGDVFQPAGQRAAAPPTTPLEVVAPLKMNDFSLKTIHLIKFSGYRSIVPLAAAAVAHALSAPENRRPAADAVLVPVPMDPAAVKRRGFNQAQLLAEGVSSKTGFHVESGALRKTRPTAPQSLTSHDARAANVRGAFAADREKIAGRPVILVDDLVTTGATAAGCASALLSAGAGSVVVACFARFL